MYKSICYMGNFMAIRDAKLSGAFEPVFYNKSQMITEGAIRNIFFIKDNECVDLPDPSIPSKTMKARFLYISPNKIIKWSYNSCENIYFVNFFQGKDVMLSK